MKHGCPVVVCAGMPPKNSLRGRGKGKTLPKRSTRSRQVPARFRAVAEVEADDENDLMEVKDWPGNEQQGLAAQLAATNARLDSLTQLVQQTATSSGSTVAPLSTHPVPLSTPSATRYTPSALNSPNSGDTRRCTR